MDISIELTLTPLQENYEQPIIDFIIKLRESPFTVLENPLSTQIYGEYVAVTSFLMPLIGETFGTLDAGLCHMKLVKTDRSDVVVDY